MHPHLGRPSSSYRGLFDQASQYVKQATDTATSAEKTAQKAAQQAEQDAQQAAQQAGAAISTATGVGTPMHGGGSSYTPSVATSTTPSLTTIMLGGATIGALLFWWKRR